MSKDLGTVKWRMCFYKVLEPVDLTYSVHILFYNSSCDSMLTI